MTNAAKDSEKPHLPFTTGVGTAISAIGLVVVFFGYMKPTPWVIGMGGFFVGLGVFIALVCVTIYLLNPRR